MLPTGKLPRSDGIGQDRDAVFRINPLVLDSKRVGARAFSMTVRLHSLSRQESDAVCSSFCARNGAWSPSGQAHILSGTDSSFRALLGDLDSSPATADVARAIAHALSACESPVSYFRASGRTIVLNRTLIMGILNVTPDSFSDGGRYYDPEAGIRHAMELIDAGADIIDIGGESSRPGATPVTMDEELRRVLPVVKAVVNRTIVSIDTMKPDVALRALDSGACIINDISACTHDPGMFGVCRKYGAGLILMHMRGNPTTMQNNPVYGDVLGEISLYLRKMAAGAIDAGVKAESVIIDPGIGFGKTLEQNLVLLSSVKAFKSLGHPVMVGPSRKSFIGKILDLPPDKRLEGTAAAVAVSAMGGASIVRVHDVLEMKRVAVFCDAVRNHGNC